MITHSYSTRTPRPLLVVVGVLLLTIGGCSDRPRTYPAAGRVVYRDGAPVVGARIESRAVGQTYTARGAVDSDGHFNLSTFKTNDGAVAGRHQVIVVKTFSADVDDLAKHRSHQSQQRKLDGKYSRYESSGLEIQIDPSGDNQSLRVIVE